VAELLEKRGVIEIAQPQNHAGYSTKLGFLAGQALETQAARPTKCSSQHHSPREWALLWSAVHAGLDRSGSC